MEGEAWVPLALEKLGCAQKDLAARLGVSPTQISKWKSGEHMSSDMEKHFRELTGIKSLDPRFVLWAGSVVDAERWDKLIHHLAVVARDGDESGYDTYPLQDDLGLLSWFTFHTLKEMGVTIPKPFPPELYVDYDSDEVDIEKLIEDNPYSDLILRIFKSLTDVWGFYAAYIYDLVFNDDVDAFEVGSEVESCLMDLAACKIAIDPSLAPKFGQFKFETHRRYREWLNQIKDKAFQAGKPLKAELLSLVYDDHDSLGHEAEAESLGFNESRLHPDVYMNELLCGMRAIHQVLPAILDKLGIDEKEFQLDTSEFRVG